jgi:hypothetical protein
MRINEITYGSGIQSLTQYLDTSKSDLVGHVDSHQVYSFNLGNGTCFFLFDDTQQRVLSYVAISKDNTSGYIHLRQIENVSGVKGSISTLLYYLINEQKLKFVITKDEPLTHSGLKWIISAIQSSRSLFRIRDQDGNAPPAKLYDEWIRSKNENMEGSTSIYIESTERPVYNKIFEAPSGFMKNSYRILKDNELE